MASVVWQAGLSSSVCVLNRLTSDVGPLVACLDARMASISPPSQFVC